MIGRDVLNQIKILLRPMQVRIANSIARAVVQLVDDGQKLQRVQISVLAGELVDGAEHFQPYGFFSVPLSGAEAVVMFPNGDRGHALVVAVSDRRTRPTSSQGGESGLYTDEGDEIRLARGHVIVLKTTGQIRLGSSAATIPPALATELAALKSLVAAWTPVSGDGGASLKAVIAGWSVPGAAKVRVE